MKVYIGPYVNRWTSQVHYNYMNKKYDFHWGDNNTRYEHFLERLEDTLQWIYNKTINRYFDNKQRKIKVKIHNYDTWSMDDTLAHIIVPMLKQLKETKHGSPIVDMEDRPEHLRTEEVDEYKLDIYHHQAWCWVLDEMIWAFEQKTLDDWQEPYYGEWVKDDSKTLGGWFQNCDREGLKKHQERMSNGFKLFGKYYEALWD